MLFQRADDKTISNKVNTQLFCLNGQHVKRKFILTKLLKAPIPFALIAERLFVIKQTFIFRDALNPWITKITVYRSNGFVKRGNRPREQSVICWRSLGNWVSMAGAHSQANVAPDLITTQKQKNHICSPNTDSCNCCGLREVTQ